jgi:hypothetical protein
MPVDSCHCANLGNESTPAILLLDQFRKAQRNSHVFTPVLLEFRRVSGESLLGRMFRHAIATIGRLARREPRRARGPPP